MKPEFDDVVLALAIIKKYLEENKEHSDFIEKIIKGMNNEK